MESHSDDGGYTWTAPQPISGSNLALCTTQIAGPAGVCDENQFSVPTIRPDGSIVVAFENAQNTSLREPGEIDEDQYLVVSSSNGGATWSAPSFVVGLEDGSRDYPINVDGRQTLSGYQVRVNSGGNIVADPHTGALYLVFSDNRAGTHDVANPVTNTNVYLMTSSDGHTWSGPTLVDRSRTDQWFPWVDVNPIDGSIGVLYHSRSSSDPDLYNTVLAEGSSNSLHGSVISTLPSNAVDSLFFQAAGVPGCEECVRFHGDYIGLAYGSDGVANAAWTDMRDLDTASGLYRQFIYFAKA
jgi:Neuraminidase (sialidase)